MEAVVTEGYPYLVKSYRGLPKRIKDRAKGSMVDLDPSKPRVSIYCRGHVVSSDTGIVEESHEADPWFVASFVRNVYDGKPRWVMSMHYPMADGSGFSIGNDPAGQLVGDKPVDPSNKMAAYDPAFRIRYALKCGTCGLRSTRRPDEINGDLEKLYSAGVFELSLHALGAMFRRNAENRLH